MIKKKTVTDLSHKLITAVHMYVSTT